MPPSTAFTLDDLARRGITALLFDMDGVLADTSELHLQAWLLLAERVGLGSLAAASVRAMFGQVNDTIIPQLFGAQADVAQLGSDKERLYRELARGKLTPYRHVDRALRAARRRGFQLAIGTSAPIENVRFLLAELALEDAFDRLVDRSQFARGKPAPDVFLEAARQLRVAPGCCAVFEDSLHGLAAARAAQMLVVGVAGTHEPATLARHADLIVCDFLAIC
ncbi:MAG: HAD family phosphatase [Planctomycetota bacterium]